MPTFAGRPVTISEIRATTRLLRYYRRFLDSDYPKCHDPEHRCGHDLNRDEVRDRLPWLINVAINRKAGIPDVAGRKQGSEYQEDLRRDRDEIRDHRRWRRALWGLNGRRFRTGEIQRRFGHLLEG